MKSISECLKDDISILVIRMFDVFLLLLILVVSTLSSNDNLSTFLDDPRLVKFSIYTLTETISISVSQTHMAYDILSCCDIMLNFFFFNGIRPSLQLL